MGYAEIEDVESGFRALNGEEQNRCFVLLEEAAAIIDAYGRDADPEIKKLVSCRMVRRMLADNGDAPLYPMGATQGSASVLGYTQSWTMGSGSAGELYLSKLEKKLLGAGSRIGAASPLEGLCDAGH